ncbi:MAG: response regulator [Caulobacterales bacterium]
MNKPTFQPVAGIPPEHLAALSHEFRTPLNGVLGMTRLLDGTRLTAEQRAYVTALMESGEHLLGLVNDVLDYAKLGAGRVDLALAPLDVEQLLRSVCELLSPRAHEKGIEIGWAAEAGLPQVLADEGRLKQILLNLAGNAVKFVDAGGMLILAERGESRNGETCRLRFTVSDTGPGVSAEAQTRIFEAFIQADPAQGSKLGGAGLGLAIANRIAEAMGGELAVESVEGRGADFRFEADFEAAGPGVLSSPLAGRTVAIASPSAIVREAAARQIETSGGRAMRGRGVDEVLALTGGGDVVLIDHALAPPRGRLKPPEDRATVILLRPEERARIGAYRHAGFAGYLIKPLRRASLVERVLAADGTAHAREDDRVAPPPEPHAAIAGGARVLLAEDNPINAMLARTLLRREGAVVDHVEGGEAALEALSRGRYDLVLMDVRMPGLSGLDTTRALRARGVEAPVVALTANAFEDDRRACLEAGMDDFLVKPLSPEALRKALVRWTGAGWTGARRRAKVAR